MADPVIEQPKSTPVPDKASEIPSPTPENVIPPLTSESNPVSNAPIDVAGEKAPADPISELSHEPIPTVPPVPEITFTPGTPEPASTTTTEPLRPKKVLDSPLANAVLAGAINASQPGPQQGVDQIESTFPTENIPAIIGSQETPGDAKFDIPAAPAQTYPQPAQHIPLETHNYDYADIKPNLLPSSPIPEVAPATAPTAPNARSGIGAKLKSLFGRS